MLHIPNLIIGGGIAGIYLAHLLTKKSKKFILIEKNDYFGGRMKWQNFYGTYVTLGAGVIRDHDIQLQKLCTDLGLEMIKAEQNVQNHIDLNVSLQEMLDALEKIDFIYKKVSSNLVKVSFREFLEIYFSTDFVQRFKNFNAYNDFWDADVHQTINTYPLSEIIYRPSIIYKIKEQWRGLIDALLKSIDSQNLHLNEYVKKIDWGSRTVQTNVTVYQTDRLFICTDKCITFSELILPPEIMKTLNIIGSVKFLRMYTYHPFGHGINSMRVPGSLEKIFSINEKILMSAYTEDQNAQFLRDILLNKNRDEIINNINSLLRNILEPKYQFKPCTDYVIHFWDHGVHFYHPCIKNEIITQSDGVFLLGEMASQKQGWTEGAIESVNLISDII